MGKSRSRYKVNACYLKGASLVSLVKAMVFPVVMYGRESWTVNKAEC